MLKHILSGVGMFLFFTSNACDVCGCIGSSSIVGISPTNEFHYFGIRSTYRTYNSYTTSEFTGLRSRSSEYFLNSELYGKYQISKRWQIMASIPYSYTVQKEDTTTKTRNGIGDVNIHGFYTPYVVRDENGKIKRQLNVGAGIKFPTGKSAASASTMSNMYPGTGAFDYIFAASYMNLGKKIGFQADASYTLRTENKYRFKYGDVVNAAFNVYYSLKAGKSQFRPFIGVQFNHFGQDKDHGKIDDESVNNGYVLGGTVGINFIRSNWFVSAYGQLPITQNIGNGDVVMKGLANLSISYLIPKKEKKK